MFDLCAKHDTDLRNIFIQLCSGYAKTRRSKTMFV